MLLLSSNRPLFYLLTFFKFPLQLSIIYVIMIMQGGGKCRLGIVFCFWKSYLLSKASIFLIAVSFSLSLTIWIMASIMILNCSFVISSISFSFLTLAVLFSRLRFVLTVIILYHIMQTMSIENGKNIIQIANDIFV